MGSPLLCIPQDGEWPLLSLCSWAPCGSTVTVRVEGLGWLRNPAFVWEAGGKGLKCLHFISLLRSLNLSWGFYRYLIPFRIKKKLKIKNLSYHPEF